MSSVVIDPVLHGSLTKVKTAVADNVAVQAAFRPLGNDETRAGFVAVARDTVKNLGVALSPKIGLLLNQVAESEHEIEA